MGPERQRVAWRTGEPPPARGALVYPALPGPLREAPAGDAGLIGRAVAFLGVVFTLSAKPLNLENI